MNHNIWSHSELWLETIEFAISAKVKTDRESLQRIASRRRKSGFMGALKHFAGKIPAAFAKDEGMLRSATQAVISQFNFYMLQMGLKMETAT